MLGADLAHETADTKLSRVPWQCPGLTLCRDKEPSTFTGGRLL